MTTQSLVLKNFGNSDVIQARLKKKKEISIAAKFFRMIFKQFLLIYTHS